MSKTTQQRNASIFVTLLFACMLSCAVMWLWSTFFVDDTTRMEGHVKSVCASTMTVTEAIDRCNAEYVVSLYADVLVQCEQTYGKTDPFDYTGYGACMADLGIRLQ